MCVDREKEKKRKGEHCKSREMAGYFGIVFQNLGLERDKKIDETERTTAS